LKRIRKNVQLLKDLRNKCFVVVYYEDKLLIKEETQAKEMYYFQMNKAISTLKATNTFDKFVKIK